jgi:glycine/D-amino acid oxidase-like deaminating enzyme
MTLYGRSPWVDGCPKSLIPSLPRQRGRLATDVVVVGGGLTGCATAYAFAAAGVKVVLLEAGRLGRGSSGSAAGWLSDDPGASFVDVQKAHGLKAARHVWQAWRRAALDFAALLRRLDVACDLQPHGTLAVAMSPEQGVILRRELQARRAAGLEASIVLPRALAAESAVAVNLAVRTHGGGTLDPYRATLGLAQAAADRGARLFEHSAVQKVTFTRRIANVVTKEGVIRTRRVVIATLVPTPLFSSLERHFWFDTSYLVLTDPIPAKVRQRIGGPQAVLRDSAVPPHIVRWVNGERLLVAGADGRSVPVRQRDKTLVQRTGQLMYELSTIHPDMSGIMPARGWDAAYSRTSDRLPYIGPHRNFPHHLFALGDASHGVTGAYLASRVLLRHHLGEVGAADEVFGFNR